MKYLTIIAATLSFVSAASLGFGADVQPLKALYITGGCCHDYTKQKLIISEGVSARANVTWEIVQEGGSATKHRVSLYEKPGWSKGYDIVVHNECFAEIEDAAFIENVLAEHRNGTPAIVIHCTMHTFRSLKTDDWREFLGVKTTHHGPQHPLDVRNLKAESPIMQGFPEVWTTINEELYAIDKVFPTATVLASAMEKKQDKATGKWVDTTKDNPVVWINQYGKGRVFGTTLAHNNVTMQNTNYMNMMARGILWACDKLDEKGQPKPGYGPAKSAQ
jgi:type 1 glutamine amidotransferase